MTKLFELKSKIKISNGVKLIIYECLCFALGFYLASVRFIFGIYPFGIPLLCASKRFSVFSFCGALLSYIFLLDLNLPYIIALSCVLGLRIICSLIQRKDKHASIILGKSAQGSILNTLFYENPSVRVVISTFCSLGLGVYFFIANGFSFFDGFVALFFAIISGVLTFAFLGAFENESKKGFVLAICAILFAVLYGIRTLEIWGLNICIIISCATVLYVSKHLSTAYAGATGLLLGLCAGASYAPAIAILGLISGFLWKTSSYLAIMSAFVVGGGYAIFSAGYEAIIYLIPEMLLSCLIMYSLLKFEVLPVPSFFKAPSKDAQLLVLENQSMRARELLGNMGATLSDISQMLREVSQKSKILTRSDMLSLCYECCESQCFGCPKQGICWEKDTETTENAIKSLSSAGFSNGLTSTRDVSERFLHRCPNIDTIIEKINAQIKQNRTQGLKNDKLEACSYDFELTGKMLSSVTDKAFDGEINDTYAVSKLKRASVKIGFVCDELCVFGSKHKKIIALGVDTERTKCTKELLKKAFEKALGVPLTEPKIEQGESTTITLYSQRSLSASCDTLSIPSKNEEINGDSCTSFDVDGTKFYTILCDGMGSGKGARLTSMLCTTFLQKLLARGNDKDSSLLLLNNFIRARGKESSCTIDLLELDLITGSGKLIKSGAAPSFIKRGENVFKLESKTMPIGIIKGLDAQILSFEARKGDICIMLSDGVVCDESDANHLIKLLKNEPSTDKKALGAKIINEMKARHDHTDDMTISIIEIS